METTLANDDTGGNREEVGTQPISQQSAPTDMAEGVRIRYVLLDSSVAGYVSNLFVMDVGPQGLDEPLQPDWGVLAFALAGSWTWSKTGNAGPDDRLTFGTLFGPMDRAVRVTTTPHARCVGMALTPLGWSQLVGLPADQLAGSWRPIADQFEESTELLEHLIGAPDDQVLTTRLLRWVSRRIRLAPAPDPHITLIGAALEDPTLTTVEELAARTGLNPLMLERLCPLRFGYAPATLLERQRFLRSLRLLQTLSLTQDVSDFKGEYPDRTAFEAAFQEVMGQCVAEYLDSPRLMLMAGMRAAAALAGKQPSAVR